MYAKRINPILLKRSQTDNTRYRLYCLSLVSQYKILILLELKAQWLKKCKLNQKKPENGRFLMTTPSLPRRKSVEIHGTNTWISISKSGNHDSPPEVQLRETAPDLLSSVQRYRVRRTMARWGVSRTASRSTLAKCCKDCGADAISFS